MVTIKPKQPSSNTLQKKETSIDKKPIIPVEGIVTKRIMEYDEYEEVEGTEYLVVQGEKVPKRNSVDNLFGSVGKFTNLFYEGECIDSNWKQDLEDYIQDNEEDNSHLF